MQIKEEEGGPLAGDGEGEGDEEDDDEYIDEEEMLDVAERCFYRIAQELINRSQTVR